MNMDNKILIETEDAVKIYVPKHNNYSSAVTETDPADNPDDVKIYDIRI